MIGVKTVGHATLIAFDGPPLLVTDPWLDDDPAYFGSWQLSHRVPAQELEELRACPYVWISHGHPDHLCLSSLERLRHATILVPDHVGGRIHRELSARGFRVRVLPERRWVQLSKRVRICCMADAYQNGVLFLDVGGTLFLDLNDASERGWGDAARMLAARYRRSFLLKLAQVGNLGVFHVYDEAGQRLQPDSVARHQAPAQLAFHADRFGVTDVIPFSSFHRCQRSDSEWVNPLLVCVEDFPRFFASPGGARLHPPFLEVDVERDRIRELAPEATERRSIPPEAFGDVWSDPLEGGDLALLQGYFESRELLREGLGFVNLRVGGVTRQIVLNPELRTGVTFEAPRASLVEAARFEVFDDLLLGHFMRTTLHGLDALSPHVLPALTRYADNGGARSRAEVERYLAEYRRREALSFLHGALAERSEALPRPASRPDLSEWS